MKPAKVLLSRQCADINRTEKLICVQPLSGYRMIQPEDDGHVIYLMPRCKRRCLGRGAA
jgi:hypothetical protein